MSITKLEFDGMPGKRLLLYANSDDKYILARKFYFIIESANYNPYIILPRP